MIGLIAGREARSLLASPSTWAMAAVLQVLFAWRFLQRLGFYYDEVEPKLDLLSARYGVTDLVVVRYLGDPWLIVLALLVMALLATRLLAEDRRGETLSLWLAAPVGSWQIIVGKWLGGMALPLLMWALMVTPPLVLAAFTPIDLGVWAAASLGMALLFLALSGPAIWFSTANRQALPAAAATFGLGLLLLLVHNSGGEDSLLSRLGLIAHYDGFLRGQVHLSSLVYLGVWCLGGLALAVRRLDALRLES